MLTRPPRVAVLCSRRCPGLESLLAAHRRGELELVCCVASQEGVPDWQSLEAVGVPVIRHSIRDFYAGRPIGDLFERREFDRRTAHLLARHRPDVVLLSSYLYLLTAPMLEAFPGRIVNVHAGDLARTGAQGRPLYTGLRAVRNAIRAGERETRATVHVVTERLDDGPILMRSRPFPVSPLVADLLRRNRLHAVNAYAYAHQEWMLATAWGPLLTTAVTLMSLRLPRTGEPLPAPATPPSAFVSAIGGRP